MKNIDDLIKNKNYKEALIILNSNLKNDPKNEKVLHLVSLLKINLKQYENAVVNLRTLINLYPKYKYLITLAKTYIQAENFKEAEFTLKKISNLETNDAEIHNLLGIVFAKQNKEDSAVNYFVKSLKLNKNYLDPIYNLLEIYEKTNNEIELKKILDHGLNLDKKNNIFLFYKAINFEKKK